MHPFVCILALAASPTPPGAHGTAAVLQAQDVAAEFDKLVAAFEAAQESYYGKLRALYGSFDDEKATAEQRKEFEAKVAELEKLDPTPEYLDKFAELAERAAGTDTAAKSWIQVLQLDRGGPLAVAVGKTGKALKVLLESHIESKELEALGWRLDSNALGDRRFNEVMTTLRTKSPHREVQASALRALAEAKTGWGASESDRPAGRALWIELKEKYGELKTPYEKTYGQLAEGTLFAIDNLQVGCMAPDFEVVDETGAKFKLSDYKGKVVVVDFWGFW